MVKSTSQETTHCQMEAPTQKGVDDMPMTLSEFFAQKRRDGETYYTIAEKTGLGHSTIENIEKGKLKDFPEIPTLQKIADAYELPLWRVVEMAAGVTSWNGDVDAEVNRLMIDAPDLRPALAMLSQLPPDSQRACIAYFASVVRHAGEQRK